MKNGIDLHLHLDGSLTPMYIIRQAKKQGIALPTWDETKLIDYLRAPKDCHDLNEYLEKFALSCSVLQTEDAITDAVADLCQRLTDQGLSYAEIRFAPQLHVEKGLTQKQVVEAAVKGLPQREHLEAADGVSQSGPADTACRFKAHLILCCMRMEGNEKENLETIKTAAEYLHQGVVAADLAGAEALYPTSSFENIFKEAVRLHVPFTIHAGEAAGPDSIRAALNFGAVRIGHGVRALEDERLTEYLREHQVPLEVCITSNFQTRAISGPYPLKEMLKKGICVTLNTDNMTVSETTLEKEFRVARDILGLSPEEIQKLKDNAKKAKISELGQIA